MNRQHSQPCASIQIGNNRGIWRQLLFHTALPPFNRNVFGLIWLPLRKISLTSLRFCDLGRLLYVALVHAFRNEFEITFRLVPLALPFWPSPFWLRFATLAWLKIRFIIVRIGSPLLTLHLALNRRDFTFKRWNLFAKGSSPPYLQHMPHWKYWDQSNRSRLDNICLLTCGKPSQTSWANHLHLRISRLRILTYLIWEVSPYAITGFSQSMMALSFKLLPKRADYLSFLAC